MMQENAPGKLMKSCRKRPILSRNLFTPIFVAEKESQKYWRWILHLSHVCRMLLTYLVSVPVCFLTFSITRLVQGCVSIEAPLLRFQGDVPVFLSFTAWALEEHLRCTSAMVFARKLKRSSSQRIRDLTCRYMMHTIPNFHISMRLFHTADLADLAAL
jgi:hypothetical protein